MSKKGNMIYRSLIWWCICLGVLSAQAPMVMRLPRSPQMPPTVAARQPARSKSIHDDTVVSVQIEQKSSHRHPYLTRYEYSDDHSYRSEENKESQKRSAMPSSPFIASRISVSEKQANMAAESVPPIISAEEKKKLIPPKNYFPKYAKGKQSSQPERSVKEYLDIQDTFSYNEKDRHPAGSYQKVLDKMRITDEEAQDILYKKGVIFEEFINFIGGGASMEQVKQLLRVSNPEDFKTAKTSKKNNKRPSKGGSPNQIPPPKKKSKHGKNIVSDAAFDTKDLPVKDSPIIAHFRKVETKPKNMGSASILSLSIEEAAKPAKSASREHSHPHMPEKPLKDEQNYQSDQATVSGPEFRFEDGLRMFLIICGGIGGIILLSTIILVIYNVLTCKESRMAQRNYELSQQIRSTEDPSEIC